MAKKRTYQDDDGRTIADMSGVGPSPMLFPRMPKKATPQEPSPADDRPWESQEQFTPEQRRAAMGGALKAAMLIAGVFIAAGAVAILVMQLICVFAVMEGADESAGVVRCRGFFRIPAYLGTSRHTSEYHTGGGAEHGIELCHSTL